MGKEVVILLAEDDEGHASLIIENLKRAGITNKFVHFKDGQETLDFLFQRGDGLQRSKEVLYTLLLDIRIPKVDGFEVIDQVKSDIELKKIPIIMISTTDDPGVINYCYKLGCKKYVVKPLRYDEFRSEIINLGQYLLDEVIPSLHIVYDQ